MVNQRALREQRKGKRGKKEKLRYTMLQHPELAYKRRGGSVERGWRDKLLSATDITLRVSRCRVSSLPQLAPNISKTIQDVQKPGTWADNFEDTEVHIEGVIAYWSRSLKSAE